ncbi:MAG: hypothetical protein GY801_38730 [bacterium]|nr:hypothetical protein [bacterium]
MNLLERLLIKFGELLELFGVLSEEEDALRKFALTIGWDLDEIVGLPVEELIQAISEFAGSYQQIVEDIVTSPPESLPEYLDTLNSIGHLISSIQAMQRIMDHPDFDKPTQFEEFGKDVLRALTATYIRVTQPVLYHVAVLLTLIEDVRYLPFSEPVITSQGQVVRLPYVLPKFRFGRTTALLEAPISLLRNEYLGPNGLATAEDAAYTSNRLFPRLDTLLSQLGFDVVYGIKPEYGLDFGEAGNELGAGMLTFFFESDMADIDFGFTLTLSPADRGNLGLVVVPFGEMNFSEPFDTWLIELAMAADIQGFAVGPEGLTLLADQSTARIDAQFSANKLPDEVGSAFIFGNPQGTRFEIAQFGFSGYLNLSDDDQDYGVLNEIDSAALVISSSDGDGFLQKILPPEGIRADFDLTIGWSNKKGLYFRGSAGLEATLPVQISLFGALSIDFIYLSIKIDDGGIQNIVAASISTQIGPVQAVVDRIGLEANFTFPEDGGNLGPLDLDFGFKSPTAIGLSVDAEGITGGGFLKIDPPNYAGMLQLSFQNEIDLTAFGLITTKLPDGKDGFSLIIQIMAEFQPIQIGLGFALTGVGGLIGINRQLCEEGMRAAFKSHSLNTILFPQNPIKDAVKLIESIQSIMPPKEGYHIIGPMVKMFWGGSIRLVEFEVGIFIQIGGPLKIVLIGQAWSLLPNEESPRLAINVDVLGILDFGEERVAIDATLFDSRILNLTLDGQMALRADWSSGEENFALSVGGFNPRFKNIPPGFPSLRRLMVSMGDNPHLSLTMYLAITTNTLQVGAQLEIWAKKSGFTVEGGAGFDALFTFSPFSFVTDVRIWVSVSKWGFELGVWLELELSGPNPFIASGYAKFKVGWFTKKVKFRKEFGDKVAEPLPVVSPLAALKKELEHPRSIRFQLPAWASANLVFTKDAESKIDPLSDITIIQDAVPLNFTMDRFGGGTPPEAEKELKITAGPDIPDEQPVKSLFAPEQFKNWSIEQRLSAKPFEKYDAGIRFSGEYVIPEDDLVEEREIAFETVLRESKQYLNTLRADNYINIAVRTVCVWQPTAQLLNNWSNFGSKRYYKPLREIRDESNPNLVKIKEK